MLYDLMIPFKGFPPPRRLGEKLGMGLASGCQDGGMGHHCMGIFYGL